MRKSRTLALGLVSALAVAPLGIGTAEAAPRTGSSIATLNGKVIDGGQQVVSVTLETTKYRINPASLDVNTFRVHATGTNPYPTTATDTTGTYDRDRTVTGVRLNSDGDIVISLVSGEDAPAAFTFGWSTQAGRNIRLNLDYTITERTAIRSRNGSRIMLSKITQGALVDKEVDAFTAGASHDGMKYRLYSPSQARQRNKRPLIVWLHGGGEGGWSGAYDGDLPLLANRGALGFATKAAQKTFGGAYVVAPQADTRWFDNDQYHYAPRVKALIDKLVATKDIDTSRIYVVGASNGGYMTLQMTADYPKLFAAQVPVCPGLTNNGEQRLSDAQLKRMASIPTWVVQATSDTTLPYAVNGKLVHEKVPGSLLSAYPDVTWAGHTFASHWSWIYVSHNDPTNAKGQHLFQWLAHQHR